MYQPALTPKNNNEHASLFSVCTGTLVFVAPLLRAGLANTAIVLFRSATHRRHWIEGPFEQAIDPMSPPTTQPPPQATSSVEKGVPLAPAPAYFPQGAFPGYPPMSGSQSQTTRFPMNAYQHQFQAAQAVQQSQNQAMNNNTQPVPNQFFMSTTTAHAAAPTGSIPQASQLAAMQQAVFAANANASVPFLISDPNFFMQAFQQNAQMQQNARQMSFSMPQQPGGMAPPVQMQQNPTMQQFPTMPPQVNASGQYNPNVNVQQTPQVPMSMPQQASQQNQPQRLQFPSMFQQAPAPAPQTVPAPHQTPHVQTCANVIHQALKDPQFQAAGHVLLKTLHASSTYMNDLMKNHHAQQGPPVQQQQVTPKAVGSEETSAIPNQVFLESSLEPVDRDEDEIDQAEEDMWKYFFKSDDEGSSNHNSEEPVNPSILSSNSASPSLPMETSPEVQPINTTLASPVASCTTAQPVPPPTLSLHEPTLKSGGSPKIAPVRAECGKVKKPSQPRKKLPITFEFQGSPQQYLMAILKERGYPSQRIPNAETGYQCKPNSLELASFGTEVVKAVNSGDVTKLNALLGCGLSPNPCNSFGDFIIHLVCRRNNFAVLQCFVDHGCNLQVCDSFGRTPLHCVAWAGEFCTQSAELILDTDTSQILVEDKRGQCPLEYVRKEQWPEWIDFLRRKMDTYWPIGAEPMIPVPKESKRERVRAISLELVAAVASGAMSPDVVAGMDESTRLLYSQESLQSILFS